LFKCSATKETLNGSFTLLTYSTYILSVEVPTELRQVEFHEKYVPPPPPEPGQRRLPEEIEAELKKQEKELEKLALISIE
jgi:hypothetical protein